MLIKETIHKGIGRSEANVTTEKTITVNFEGVCITKITSIMNLETKINANVEGA